MKLQDKIDGIILRTKYAHIPEHTVDMATKEIMKLFSPYENEIVTANSIIEAIEEILDGKEVSDFMLSFPIVRRVDDLKQAK